MAHHKTIIPLVDFDWDEYENGPSMRIHKSFLKKYKIFENNMHLKGVSDLDNTIILDPIYNDIVFFSDSLFIVATISKSDNTLIYGIVDKQMHLVAPFSFRSLLPITENYLAYTNDKIYNLTPDNKYDKLWLPSFKMGYRDIKFGIIDKFGNKITPPDLSTFLLCNNCSAFIVEVERRFGVVRTDGNYILPPVYTDIVFDDKNNIFITYLPSENFENSLNKTKSNYVTQDGFFDVKDYAGNNFKVPTSIADWCGDFSESGLAPVFKKGHKGFINRSNLFIVLINENAVVVPSYYDFVCEFIYGFATVEKKNKYGLIDCNFKQVVPCEYEDIIPLLNIRFKFKQNGKFGVIDINNIVIVKAEYDNIIYEGNFLKVQLFHQKGNVSDKLIGLMDIDGNVVVPIKYDNLTIVKHQYDYFIFATANKKCCVFDGNGRMVIPCLYDNIEIHDEFFVCEMFEYRAKYSGISRKVKKITNRYNLKGEQIISIDNTFAIIPAEFEMADYIGYGVIKVMKRGEWGLINMSNDLLQAPQFVDIYKFEGSFAKIQKQVNEDENHTEKAKNQQYKFGLVNTTGAIVLPVVYDCVEKWNNDYYYTKNDCEEELLTPDLHIAFKFKRECYKPLDSRYIIVKGHYNKKKFRQKYGLINYYGNIVIPWDEYNSFDDIEILDNGFLKVFYVKGSDCADSHIGILNNQGEIVYSNNNCNDITVIANRYLLIKEFEYTNMEGCGHFVYNIANFQGKKLFEKFYDEIRLLDDGNILIKGIDGFGMANYAGVIFIQPKYINEIKFENSFSRIDIHDSSNSLRIDKYGHVIVLDTNSYDTTLPKDYYWGSNFINGISIVRSWQTGRIGVINESGYIIIPPQYDDISILADMTILVKEFDCYGLYDISGKCILPTVFTSVEHLPNARFRVVWNLNVVKNWESKNCVSNETGDKFLQNNIDFIVKNRSALCNGNGDILNDRKFLYIGKFKDGYACAYCNIRIDDDMANQVGSYDKYGNFVVTPDYLKLKYEKVGIIDIDGNIIVEPNYDNIKIYYNAYAILEKGEKVGVVNLKTKKIKMFDDIVYAWNVDRYGRFLYTDDKLYKSKGKDCIENIGVINFDKIIVPSGKYKKLELLQNGLIKVSDEYCTLFGLLKFDGKEIIPIKYSYISNFKNGCATICLGGHSYNYAKGKWGVICENGIFLKPCIYNNEPELPNNNSFEDNDGIIDEYLVPHIICSNALLESNNRPKSNDFRECYNYDYSDSDSDISKIDDEYKQTAIDYLTGGQCDIGSIDDAKDWTGL